MKLDIDVRRGLVAFAALAVLAPAAPAAEVESERYGSLATGMPYDREIRLSQNTRRIGVWRLETIRFVTADGREFRWRFDAMRSIDSFPLAQIAPDGISVPPAMVYVNGEIPVSDF